MQRAAEQQHNTHITSEKLRIVMHPLARTIHQGYQKARLFFFHFSKTKITALYLQRTGELISSYSYLHSIFQIL